MPCGDRPAPWRRTERVLAWAGPAPTAARGGALFAVGWLARHRGETDAAEAFQTEVAARPTGPPRTSRKRWHSGALGFTWVEASALRVLGDIARDRGDLFLLSDVLAGIAGVAMVLGEPDRAARLYGATAALRERLGTVIQAWQPPRPAPGLVLFRSPLATEEFAAEALDFADSAVASAESSSSADPLGTLGLTAREGEVLRLVAGGLSDREIAAALSVSPRTVNGHVASILAKLGLETRAAAYAVLHGLA